MREPAYFTWAGSPSREVASPANRYAGRNRGGYVSAEADALVKRVQTTLDPRERERYAVELMRIWADDAGFIPIYYYPLVIAAGSEVTGYDAQVWPAQSGHTWNIHQWRKG